MSNDAHVPLPPDAFSRDDSFSCRAGPLPIYPVAEIQEALAGWQLPPPLQAALLGCDPDDGAVYPPDLFDLLVRVGTNADDLTPEQWAALTYLQGCREDVEDAAATGGTTPGKFPLLAAARDHEVLDVLSDGQVLCVLATYRVREWAMAAREDLLTVPDDYRAMGAGWWNKVNDSGKARAAHNKLRELAFIWFHDWSVNVWPVAAIALAFSGKALPDMDSGLPFFAYPTSREKTGGRSPQVSEAFYKSCHARFMAGETDCKSLVDYLLQQGQKSNRSLTRHAVRWAIKTYSD